MNREVCGVKRRGVGRRRGRGCGRDSPTREIRPDLPGRGGDETRCRRPRPGRPRPGRRRSRRLRYQPAKRSRGHSRGRGIRNDCRGSLVTPGRRARDRDEPRARPDRRRKGLWDRSRAGAHEAYPCTYVEYSVVCPLAPSRGGVLQLRGNPVHGTNPRRPVFTLRPFPCERAPPGLGLSCPQPDANHPARWVRFLAPRPWMCG